MSVTGRIIPPPPEEAHALIPRTCELVTLRGKRDSADVTTGMNGPWERADYLGLSR